MTPDPTLATWASQAAAHLQEVAEQIVGPSLGAEAEGNAQWHTSTQVHTSHDALAGAALAERFEASFPGHGLVIEDLEPRDGDGVHTWFIDPIDGSANHLRGIPYVSLTAGLMRDGVPVLGVVHELGRGITTLATAGGGAVSIEGGLGRPLRLQPPEKLSDAMAIVHIARRGPLMGREDALARLLWSVRKIRCMGSIALDLALLARGEADLLVAGRGEPQRMLDIVGGLVILEEAGGAAVDANGRPHDEGSHTLIAGGPGLCEQFVEVMAQHELESWTADETRQPD